MILETLGWSWIAFEQIRSDFTSLFMTKKTTPKQMCKNPYRSNLKRKFSSSFDSVSSEFDSAWFEVDKNAKMCVYFKAACVIFKVSS